MLWGQLKPEWDGADTVSLRRRHVEVREGAVLGRVVQAGGTATAKAEVLRVSRAARRWAWWERVEEGSGGELRSERK